MPALVIKPIDEIVPAIVDQVLRGAEVEPRVELVDDPAVVCGSVSPDRNGLSDKPGQDCEPHDYPQSMDRTADLATNPLLAQVGCIRGRQNH